MGEVSREEYQKLADRISALENKQAVLDAAVTLARWLGPIAVSVASIVVMVLLTR